MERDCIWFSDSYINYIVAVRVGMAGDAKLSDMDCWRNEEVDAVCLFFV